MEKFKKFLETVEQHGETATLLGIGALILCIVLIIGTCNTCSSVFNIDDECDCDEISENIQKYCAPYSRPEKERKQIENNAKKSASNNSKAYD